MLQHDVIIAAKRYDVIIAAIAESATSSLRLLHLHDVIAAIAAPARRHRCQALSST
jgi:hypothetical protein